MPNISLPNGKVIYIKSEIWYSMSDEEVDKFFNECIADDSGGDFEENIFDENLKDKNNED